MQPIVFDENPHPSQSGVFIADNATIYGISESEFMKLHIPNSIAAPSPETQNLSDSNNNSAKL